FAGDGVLITPRSGKSASETYALLEVELPSRAEAATVKLDGRNSTNPFRFSAAPLKLRQSDVDRIVKDSRQLRDRFSRAMAGADDWNWRADYKSLGERIYKLLWREKFPEYYAYADGAVGSSNLRLRFNLERSVFDGLWEAMCRPNERGFLMLESTMTRRTIQ